MTPFTQILPHISSLVIHCDDDGLVIVSIMSKQHRPLLEVSVAREDGAEAFTKAVEEFRNLLRDNGVRLTP